MKHLFYIHSYVTYLVTLGVIEHKDIKDEDVVLICGRGVVFDNRFKSLNVNKSFPSLASQPTYGTRWMYVKKRRDILAFDHTISELVEGNQYVCYLPSNNHFLLQLIASHKLCVAVNYIEEGLSSYDEFFYKKLWPFNGSLGLLKRIVNTGCRNVHPEKIISEGTLFTLFDPSFYNSTIHKECVMPDVSRIPYSGIKLESTNLLMMNAFRDANETVRRGLLDVLGESTKGLNEIYIKHHPYSDEKFKHDLEHTLMSSGTEVHLIPEDTPTELMLFNSRNLNIYGLCSSTMMYGALFGHKAYSFADKFKHHSAECASYLDNNLTIPNIFYNYVKQL